MVSFNGNPLQDYCIIEGRKYSFEEEIPNNPLTGIASCYYIQDRAIYLACKYGKPKDEEINALGSKTLRTSQAIQLPEPEIPPTKDKLESKRPKETAVIQQPVLTQSFPAIQLPEPIRRPDEKLENKRPNNGTQ